MKLSIWFERTGKSPVELAESIRKSVQAIYKYMDGSRIPRPNEMVAIYRATGGLVEPNDFYDLPKLPKARKAA